MNRSRQGGFYITNTAAEAQEPRGGVWEERGQQCSRESGILNVKYLHKKVSATSCVGGVQIPHLP